MITCLLLVAACDQIRGGSPEVQKCEERILANLGDRASYVRGQNDSLSLGDRWQVGIEYSYTDKTGRRITKAWQTCDYPIVNGKPDTSRFLAVEKSDD
jgi:hypothetical protein